MNSIKRSFRQFNVRAQMGRIGQSTTHISSGAVRDCEEGNQQINDDEIIAEALRILSKRLMRAHALNDRRSMGEYLAMRFAGLEHEVFACLYLDVRNRVIACEELFRGTIDRADVYSREVVKKALEHNAAGIILAHNHPSGVAEPSHADELRTLRLRDALALVDIRVLDHFVIGGADFVSFSARGLL